MHSSTNPMQIKRHKYSGYMNFLRVLLAGALLWLQLRRATMVGGV